MRNFFLRFGKPLFALTILIVLIFQGYWLWNNYENKKNEILEQTKIKMQQILIGELVFNKSLDLEKTIKDKIMEGIDLSKISKSTVSGQVIVVKTNQSKKIILEKNIGVSAVKDSILYHSIKPYMQNLYGNPDITVYYESRKRKSTYPANHTVTNNNTTGSVNSLTDADGLFRVHIENLFYIVISKMYGSILFSLLYLLLFLGTAFLLFNNVKLNRKLLTNKEVFTRNVTHELKIPISTIMIAAEGLDKYHLYNPEDAKKYANTIKRAVHQLSFLVESILQHAQAENSSKNSPDNPINLVTLLEDVKAILSEIINDRNANIQLQNISEQTYIRGDYNQMKQVFLNLFDNSIKYSEKAPEIIVYEQKIRNRVIIQIKDNGIGIPKKYTEEIFDPYFRVTDKDIHNVKGFGLGLSFVRSTLKNQNGKITVRESGPEGTIIELDIASYEL